MAEKQYKNRYWQQVGEVYELHFTHFYNDEVILKFVQDKDDPATFHYVSELLNVEDDDITEDNIEDAKEAFEYKVEEWIEEWISYYEQMLERFNEVK